MHMDRSYWLIYDIDDRGCSGAVSNALKAFLATHPATTSTAMRHRERVTEVDDAPPTADKVKTTPRPQSCDERQSASQIQHRLMLFLNRLHRFKVSIYPFP